VFDKVYILLHFNIIAGEQNVLMPLVNFDVYFQGKLNVYQVKDEMLSMFLVQLIRREFFLIIGIENTFPKSYFS